MLQQQIHRKQKSFALQRGLYVLRYETSADPANPPLVTVICETGRNEVILHPEQTRAAMSAPGQALIVRANDVGNLQVEITSSGNVGTLDVTLKFDQVRHDAGRTSSVSMAASNDGTYGSLQSAMQSANIQVLGHVARLGDVTAGGDEWLGGPTAPARVEGFLVRWQGKPSDVQLRYAGTVGGQRPGEARMVDVDEFTGTRGRARPLVGVAMELIGPGARNHQLVMEALFLGAPARRMTGLSITAAGPTGREPLVGLRIAISNSNVQAPPQQPAVAQHYQQVQQYQQPGTTFAQPAPPADQVNLNPKETPRVRVFRA